jgi:hypothetical protein
VLEKELRRRNRRRGPAGRGPSGLADDLRPQGRRGEGEHQHRDGRSKTSSQASHAFILVSRAASCHRHETRALAECWGGAAVRSARGGLHSGSRRHPLPTFQPAQMPARPPRVENSSPHVENNEACQRAGSRPPSVDPAIAPIQMSRRSLTRASLPCRQRSLLDHSQSRFMSRSLQHHGREQVGRESVSQGVTGDGRGRPGFRAVSAVA